MNTMLCIAHRGASGHEPENTLAAVEKALSLGADWIEVDTYAVEEELIVIHDADLERTTNGTGHVEEKSLAYLRSLDAGHGQGIPLLREVFDRVDRKAGINIELKGNNTEALTVSLINRYVMDTRWRYDQFIVSSFNHDMLKAVKKMEPSIRIGALIADIPPDAAYCAENIGAYSVHCDLDSVNDCFVTDAHRRGLKVFVFTVNNPGDLARMESMAVDGVFTNYPEIVVQRPQGYR